MFDYDYNLEEKKLADGNWNTKTKKSVGYLPRIIGIQYDGQGGLYETAQIALAVGCRCTFEAYVIDFENGIEEAVDNPGYYQPTNNLRARLLRRNPDQPASNGNSYSHGGNLYAHVSDNGDLNVIARLSRQCESLQDYLLSWDTDDIKYFRSEHLIPANRRRKHQR